MNKTTVVNLRSGDEYDVYIGRGPNSKWGNPFVIGKDGSRKEVIDKYREWIKTQPHLMNSLHELKGMRLACFCVPKLCHGHVLAELADSAQEDMVPERSCNQGGQDDDVS